MKFVNIQTDTYTLSLPINDDDPDDRAYIGRRVLTLVDEFLDLNPDYNYPLRLIIRVNPG